MLLRPIYRDEAKICIRAEPDDLPVRENAMVSGYDAFDREVEDGILARLDDGDAWAWAAVTVTVTWGAFTASDHLGACSYADERDFRQPGGYYDDMVEKALAELNLAIQSLYQQLRRREEAN